jgi:hypothetical protein
MVKRRFVMETNPRFLEEGVESVKLSPMTMKYIRETVERRVRDGGDIEKMTALITPYKLKVWEE